MYIYVRAYACTLFNASIGGTARLQSRFLFVYMFAGKNMIFDILDYRKNAKKFAYVKKKQYLCSKS